MDPNSDTDAAWLGQFTPIHEGTLTSNQWVVVLEFRLQFPGAKVGSRGSKTSVYVIDPELGPIVADLPPQA